MESRHVIVIAQVHRCSVDREVGEEEVIVHRGWSGPVDLVRHRRGGGHKVPHVRVDHGMVDGSVDIV